MMLQPDLQSPACDNHILIYCQQLLVCCKLLVCTYCQATKQGGEAHDPEVLKDPDDPEDAQDPQHADGAEGVLVSNVGPGAVGSD